MKKVGGIVTVLVSALGCSSGSSRLGDVNSFCTAYINAAADHAVACEGGSRAAYDALIRAIDICGTATAALGASGASTIPARPRPASRRSGGSPAGSPWMPPPTARGSSPASSRKGPPVIRTSRSPPRNACREHIASSPASPVPGSAPAMRRSAKPAPPQQLRTAALLRDDRRLRRSDDAAGQAIGKACTGTLDCVGDEGTLTCVGPNGPILSGDRHLPGPGRRRSVHDNSRPERRLPDHRARGRTVHAPQARRRRLHARCARVRRRDLLWRREHLRPVAGHRRIVRGQRRRRNGLSRRRLQSVGDLRHVRTTG